MNDPAAGSPTATLLRLLSLLDSEYCSILIMYELPHNTVSRELYAKSITDSDGRCVQEPGTYSLRSDETRIQDIPRSWRIITSINPHHDSGSKDSPPSSGQAARGKPQQKLVGWISVVRVQPRTFKEHHRPALGSCFNAIFTCIIPISKRPKTFLLLPQCESTRLFQYIK